MNKVALLLFYCGIILLLVLAGGWGYAEEAQKKPLIKDTKTLKLPAKQGSGTTDQQQPQLALQNPQVVSVEILPPLAACKARWKVTVKNPNAVPFDKPLTIKVVQRYAPPGGNTVVYKPGDGVIAPSPLPAGQTGTATGEFMGEMGNGLFLKNYTIEVQVDGKGQSLSSKHGNIPVFDQDIAISDCRLQQDRCYVTLANGKAYQACNMHMGSAYGQGPAPALWDDGIGYHVDIPPNGSMERSIPRKSGSDTIKVSVRQGSKIIAEKVMPFP
jgi:hypothetical protein